LVEAGEHVVHSFAFTGEVGDVHDRTVTDLMAEAIIDRFEIVDVDHQERKHEMQLRRVADAKLSDGSDNRLRQSWATIHTAPRDKGKETSRPPGDLVPAASACKRRGLWAEGLQNSVLLTNRSINTGLGSTGLPAYRLRNLEIYLY
jgi:hypothetical protein